MKLVDLISPAYLAEQRRLHADPRGYGQRGRKWADLVAEMCVGLRGASVLDYGCGQGSLAQALDGRPGVLRVAEYDPAIPGKDERPAFADVVVCTDVLEHVEGPYIPAVIDHLATLARRRLLAVVSLVETAKTLSDGRQAHVSLHPAGFWRDQLSRRFTILDEPQVKPEKQWIAVCRPASLLEGA